MIKDKEKRQTAQTPKTINHKLKTKMQTLHITKNAILDSTKRLKNSTNGNPRYSFNFDGLGISGKNQSDAGWIYGITPSNLEGMPVTVEFHHTKGGRVVIDSVELIKVKRNGKLLSERETLELIRKHN